MKLSKSELATLRALDFACWEDSDKGGDGWALIRSVAAVRGGSYDWAKDVLKRLAHRGLVEARLSPEVHWTGRHLKQYACTEPGSRYLLELDTPARQQNQPPEALEGSDG